MNKKHMHNIELKDIRIKDKFFDQYIGLIENEAIPYQWEALNDKVKDAEPSCCINNFNIAAGHKEGEFHGFVFQDTDLAKWLEAVSFLIESKTNSQWSKIVEDVIKLVGATQQDDGYLNTYFTIKEPEEKWTNLRECHELYTAGHMIEAAVAHYKATGSEDFLQVVCKLADHIDDTFGLGEGKIKGYGGHQEIELALIKLYKVTDEKRYLNLSKYFIDQRGVEPFYFDIESEKRGFTKHFGASYMYERDYNQTHLPVREQSDAVGHAVRAVYMYAAMADLANLTQDKSLEEACNRLWNNIVHKKLYITGAIGSTSIGEAFTFDYDLPNDTVYAETCASIGLIFFANRMLKLELHGKYGDVIEKALYNTVLSGMGLDGKSFFYVNPLEVWPEACEKNPIKKHVKPVRQKWFGCACCPPNIARLLMGLGEYIYTVNGNTIYTHLYIGDEASIQLDEGTATIMQKSNYPWSGDIRVSVTSEEAFDKQLAFRIPGWCYDFSIKVNDKNMNCKVKEGFIFVDTPIEKETTIELVLDMPVEKIYANPQVRANAGKVAIQRGPLVYCIEEVDNGDNLSSLRLSDDTQLSWKLDDDILGGIVTISGKAYKTDDESWTEELYSNKKKVETIQTIKAVPYCTWGNRNPGEMLCWIRE
jgi:hypothetical protein